MNISIDQLRQASGRYATRSAPKSLNEAVTAHVQTAFLCHSHQNADLAKGLQVLLADHGWLLYIDWQDTAMPDTPDENTAKRIKQKIKALQWFLFLATPDSMRSRWCPWEIGYADCARTPQKIIIIPTKDSSGNYHGNEYLQLYQRIVIANDGKAALFESGKDTGGKYVSSIR